MIAWWSYPGRYHSRKRELWVVPLPVLSVAERFTDLKNGAIARSPGKRFICELGRALQEDTMPRPWIRARGRGS